MLDWASDSEGALRVLVVRGFELIVIRPKRHLEVALGDHPRDSGQSRESSRFARHRPCPLLASGVAPNTESRQQPYSRKPSQKRVVDDEPSARRGSDSPGDDLFSTVNDERPGSFVDEDDLTAVLAAPLR